MTPPVRDFSQKGMHRLIPSRYSETETVLEEVVADAAMLADAARLDAATNERIQGELYGFSGISHFELVYGIPNAQIIRAAFLHPGPLVLASMTRRAVLGTRPRRLRLRLRKLLITSQSGFRKSSFLDCLKNDRTKTFPPTTIGKLIFTRPFMFWSRRKNTGIALARPVPQCYMPSQLLARQLLTQQSNGILYPSVRHQGGACLACFRPPLVYQPRRAERYEVRLRIAKEGYKPTFQVIPS